LLKATAARYVAVTEGTRDLAAGLRDGFRSAVDEARADRSRNGTPRRKQASPAAAMRTCAATRKDGAPCRGRALPGSDYCVVHRAQETSSQQSEAIPAG
jgi:hypothetical protein